MFGVFLASLGSFFTEVSDSIGKFEVRRRQENVFAMGFLNLVFGGLVLLAIALIKGGSFVFVPASLPTFAIRAGLEILQAYATVNAIARAERSTFSFIRTGTMPLLLGVDLVLGYSLGRWQIAGIGLILVTLIILAMNHGFSRRGLGFVVFSTVNAVITISLYKYDITRFNSVVAEQLIMFVVLMVYFTIASRRVTHKYPFRLLLRPVFCLQSLTSGAGSIVEGFAYSFAPASVILAAKRSSSVLWSVLSGRIYFHERRFTLKFFALVGLVMGIILLTRAG